MIDWTKPRVIVNLARYVADSAGAQLPQNIRSYQVPKALTGYLPSHHVIKRFFPTFAEAWLAAGADPSQVPLRTWTDEQIATLIRGRVEGTPVVAIAASLGKTVDAVAQQIRALKRDGRLCPDCGKADGPGGVGEHKHLLPLRVASGTM